jgi:hypothetical protein
LEAIFGEYNAQMIHQDTIETSQLGAATAKHEFVRLFSSPVPEEEDAKSGIILGTIHGVKIDLISKS